MIIRNIGDRKTSNLQIKHRNDRDGNGFKLVIQDVTRSLDAKARLDLKINGEEINAIFKNMNCEIDQSLMNRVCQTHFGGTMYQHSGQEQGAGHSTNAQPK